MQKRKLVSNFILFLFFVSVSLAAILSDILKAPVKTGIEVIEEAKLFSANELTNIRKISLKIKSGEYLFERFQSNQKDTWHMTSPRDVTAESMYIEKLIEGLSTIKIKKIVSDEKISQTNFSIDKPTSALRLYDQNDRATVITFGLMNTIDNTTYLKRSDRNGIYHVEAPKIPLENAEISDLLESKIVSLKIDQIVAFSLMNETKKLSIRKKDGAWINGNQADLNREKVEELIQDYLNLTSNMIIDKPNEGQKKQLQQLSKEAVQSFSLENTEGIVTSYKISKMFKTFPDTDLKTDEYFAIIANDANQAFLLKKESYELFSKKLFFD